MRRFNHKALVVAIASFGTVGVANAAGLDRSGQDVTAFLQDGTYAEAVYTYVDADIAGVDTSGQAIKDIAEPYDFFRYGVKADINDRFSVGVMYDEPFGAAVKYEGGNDFVSSGANATVAALTGGQLLDFATTQDTANNLRGTAGILADNLKENAISMQELGAELAAAQAAGDTAKVAQLTKDLQDSQVDIATKRQRLDVVLKKAKTLTAATNVAATAENQIGEGTNVEIRTNNATALIGTKFGANRNFQIYGGPAAQRLTGEVHLRGVAYQGAQGYDAKISTDTAVGWVAGVSYSKPEIALKAALTYRSKIKHDSVISEVFPALGANGTTSRDFSVTLPESYNLDFQTGVNPTTLLTAKVRYVPWSGFDIRPPTYGDATLISAGKKLPIVSYDKDQWSAEIGFGKKLSDKLSVAGNIGYDSGAGNPATSLGPIKGYYSVGLGAKYSVTPEWSVSLGGKYLKFGDAQAQLPTNAIVGRFKDNDGFIAGLKVAYHAK